MIRRHTQIASSAFLMAWQIVKDATIIHHLRHESALLWFYSIDIEHQKGVGVKTDDVFSRG